MSAKEANGGGPDKNLKITVVGDGIVGKTCMLIVYTSNRFPKEYIPTVFEHYGEEIVVDGVHYKMTLWDTAGQEDYERLRPLTYPNTSCFIVCYAVDGRASFENVYTKWVPEIRHYRPNTPIILVATKADLRDDPSVVCISPEEGRRMRRRIRADAYVECSAKNNTQLKDVFEAAVRASTRKKKNNTRSCVLL